MFRKILATLAAVAVLAGGATPAHATTTTKQVLWDWQGWSNQSTASSTSPIITIGTGYHVAYSWALRDGSDCSAGGYEHSLTNGYFDTWGDHADYSIGKFSGSADFYIGSAATQRWQWEADITGYDCWIHEQVWRWVTA